MPGQPGMQPTPGKQGKGLKYALIGCGCLALIAIAIVAIVWGSVILAYVGLGGSSASSSSSSGSGTCAKAAVCCKAIVAKTHQSTSACDALTQAGVPDAACKQAYATYKKSAGIVGVTCK